MPLYLSEYVCSGEIVNTRKNSVHGFISFWGCERPLILQLTGNCTAELAGRHIRFEINKRHNEMEIALVESDFDEMHLAWIQVGAPGKIAIRRLPAPPRGVHPEVATDTEFHHPNSFSAQLYLEWHGQNGHTVIELPTSDVEFVNAEEDSSDHLTRELESTEAEDDSDESWNDLPDRADSDDHEESDPFGLFPDDLENQLGSSASSQWLPEVDEETLAQWKDWDEVIDGTKDVPLSSLFDPPLKLPTAASLDDQQIAEQLNVVLAQLALHNIAFHMCEHFTPRSAYELLVESILPMESTHPELVRIGYTMNFDTAESCEKCSAEFEEEDLEEAADETSDDPTDDQTDGDVPF